MKNITHIIGGKVVSQIDFYERDPAELKQIARGRRLTGLGDLVAKATTAIGIKPCGGCKKRQSALNTLFPFRSGQSAQPASTQNHHEPIHTQST